MCQRRISFPFPFSVTNHARCLPRPYLTGTPSAFSLSLSCKSAPTFPSLRALEETRPLTSSRSSVPRPLPAPFPRQVPSPPLPLPLPSPSPPPPPRPQHPAPADTACNHVFRGLGRSRGISSQFVIVEKLEDWRRYSGEGSQSVICEELGWRNCSGEGVWSTEWHGGTMPLTSLGQWDIYSYARRFPHCSLAPAHATASEMTTEPCPLGLSDAHIEQAVRT